MIEGPTDGSGDGMGEGTGDGAANDLQDGPMNSTLGASMDTAHNEGADDVGDMDGQDKTWNPKMVSFD